METRIMGFDYTICSGRGCMSLLIGIYSPVDDFLALGSGILGDVRGFFDMERDRQGWL